MKATTRNSGILALALTATLAVAAPSTAEAGNDGTSSAPKTTYIRPVPPWPGPIHSQGYFEPGFYGHYQWQAGMVIDTVNYGSRAFRLGLEAGDAIVEVNGRRIHSEYSYVRALNAAHGHGRMLVRDCRSGYLVEVSLRPFGPYPFPYSPVQARTN